jgi:hypothetical protein
MVNTIPHYESEGRQIAASELASVERLIERHVIILPSCAPLRQAQWGRGAIRVL